MNKNLPLELHLFEEGAMLMRAINNELRQDILAYLHKHGRLKVFEIYRGLQMEQTVVSLHLGILRQAHFVNAKRDGQSIYYSINYDRLQMVQQKLHEILK